MSKQLPTGWQVAKLGELFDSGKVVVEKGIPLKKSEVTPGSIPVIAGGKTSPYNHNSSTHSISCITISSSGAYAGYVWFHSEPIWASDCSVIYSKHHLTEYLYYFLKANQARVYASQVGSGQPHVYPKDLKTLAVLLPPLQEQKAIASILQKWDEAIEKTEALISAKQKQFEWLSSALISQIEQSSEIRSIKEFVNFVDGYPFQSSDYHEQGQYNVLTIANVQNGYMTNSFTGKLIEIPAQVERSQVLGVGDILISMTGNVGRICKVNLPNCLLNQRVGKLVPATAIDSEYLYFSLLSRRFIRSMIRVAQGGAQGNLSKKDIIEYQIPLPPLPEQKRIGHILNTAQREIDLLKQLADRYRTQKRGLMQKLLTGEWRVF